MIAIFHIFSNVDFMLDDIDRVYWMRGGVDIFFVISGFVMVQSTAARDISPREFFLHRAQRIVPLYWIATLAMMMQVQGQWTLKIYSLFFIPMMNPKVDMMQPILEPGWTLNYEMFFYALFALSLFSREKYRFLAITLVMGCLVAVGVATESSATLEFFCRPIILEFIAGMAIAKFGLRLPIVALPAGLLAMILLQPVMADRLFTLGVPAILIVSGALSAEKRLPDWTLAHLLGSASYAIYLFHLLILGMIVKIWPLLDWGDEAFGAIAFTAMIAAGCGIYWSLEKPIIVFFAALKSRRRQPDKSALTALS